MTPGEGAGPWGEPAGVTTPPLPAPRGSRPSSSRPRPTGPSRKQRRLAPSVSRLMPRSSRVVAQHLAQPVARDPAAQMMDVVDADIGGEPAQHARQVEVRAAVQRRLRGSSSPPSLPVGVLELVLDVEQPDPDRRRPAMIGSMHQQERARRRPAPAAAATSHRDGEVGRHRAAPRPPPAAHQADRAAGASGRTDRAGPTPSRTSGWRYEAVERAAASASSAVLAHGQRVDVADPAPVEIAGGGVVDGVAAPPVAVGRQRQRRRSPGRPSRWRGAGGRTSRGRSRAGS